MVATPIIFLNDKKTYFSAFVLYTFTAELRKRVKETNGLGGTRSHDNWPSGGICSTTKLPVDSGQVNSVVTNPDKCYTFQKRHF